MVCVMKKSIYISIILFTILFIALISIIVLVNRPNTVSNIEQENILTNVTTINKLSNNTENISISTNFSEVKLSPNCKITFIKNYSICGHSLKDTEPISDDLVNLSKQDFLRLYENWEITKFESSIVELSKTIPDYCGEHYVAKDLDGYIAIYSIDSIDSSNNLSLINKTEILTKYLPEGDTKKLYEGVIIYGKDNLNSFLEDFE